MARFPIDDMLFGSLLETMADDDCGVFKESGGADEINSGDAFGFSRGSITSIEPLVRHGSYAADNGLMSDYDPIWYPG